MQQMEQDPSSALDAVAARAEALVKQYGDGDAAVRAVDGVSLAIPARRMTAIMGPSGSGKSTLMHCLAGLDQPTSGRVWIGTHELSALSDRELTRLRRARVGFVFQSFNLVPTLDAEENITLPFLLAGAAPDADWVGAVVERVGLGDRLRHRPAEMSGGQQQRVAVARAVVTRPAVVFADEPTGNLDRRSGHEVLGLLREVVDELTQTVVMVTHDPAAAAIADRVVFLSDGRVTTELDAPTPERVVETLVGIGG